MTANKSKANRSDTSPNAMRAPLAGKLPTSAPSGRPGGRLAADDALTRLDRFEERAAVLEYDAGLSRARAEARARLEVFGVVGRPEEWS